MSKTEHNVDLCVIGAGSAGLSVASGAVQLGLSVVLFEAGRMGGDCLNVGCVPSKALIAAAAHAQAIRAAPRFGVQAGAPSIDWPAVQAHVRSAIAAIEPNDSQARFEGLGVTVIREAARFADERTVESDSARVRAKRIVIATGSRPSIPPIPGLAALPYLTNETVFDIAALPTKLIILGAGAVGMELGQAFGRLGVQVTMVEAGRALAQADREGAELVLTRLRGEGVDVLEGWKATGAAQEAGAIALQIESGAGERRSVTGSHLLIAAGRTASLHGLDLEAGGVAFDNKGVTVSETLRSVSNQAVWALGDAAGRELFTHAAGWHASVWVRNVLFKARTRADAQAMPSVVFTDPELAQIGLTEAAARAAHGDGLTVTRWSFADNDRAQAGADTEGFCKLIAARNGTLLGATIVGAEAGELIGALSYAMAGKVKLRGLTAPIIAYPTRAEIIKRAASAAYAPLLFSGRTRGLVNLLKRIP